jgi:hypothetical protein
VISSNMKNSSKSCNWNVTTYKDSENLLEKLRLEKATCSEGGKVRGIGDETRSWFRHNHDVPSQFPISAIDHRFQLSKF